VDVRVVAATNRDLTEEVRAGRFREDLFYRLSVFPIEVPPLRDRIDHIAPLAAHLIELICRELGRDTLRLTQQNLPRLKALSWPGNIRELKNVIKRAVISTTGNRLRLDLALPDLTESKSAATPLVPDKDSEFLTDAGFRELEKANTLAALRSADWQVWGDEGAATLLGIKLWTLTYRMKMFRLKKTGAREPGNQAQTTISSLAQHCTAAVLDNRSRLLGYQPSPLLVRLLCLAQCLNQAL
jgi:transcriptional regulator with GAF, ATPase, and Fis domain